MCGGRCNGVTAVADRPSDRFRISNSCCNQYHVTADKLLNRPEV